MNESRNISSQRRRPPRWVVPLGFVGVVAVAAVIVGRPLVESARRHLASTSPHAHSPSSPAAAIATPHLEKAEHDAERAIEEHIRVIDAFFADAKKGTRTFAEEMLNWSSKWRLVADYVPFTAGDRHERYIRSKFEEHVFKADQLEETVRQVVKSYLAHVRSIESKMLVDLRADVSDLPTTYPITQLDDRRLQDRFDRALARAAEATGADLRANIATELVTLITTEVVTQVAVRLGVSAGILGSGAASSWATFGIGLVAAAIVDQIVSRVWNWLADPRGSLAADVEKLLDEIHRSIVDGSPDVQGLRDRLKQFARERAALRRAAVLSLLQTGGAR